MSDLFLFAVVVALWAWVAWVIFRRVGFFGAQRPPRFRVVKDGKLYTNAQARYLLSGVLGGRHVVFIFRGRDGQPFVYMPRDKDVSVLGGDEELESFVRDHCGGDKGLAKLRLAVGAERYRT